MPPPLFDKRSKPAFVIACLVLLGSGLGFNLAVKALNVYLRKERVEMRGSFDTLPRVVGRWQAVGQDRVLDEATIEALGTNRYLVRDYALSGKRGSGLLNVQLAYYTGMIDTVPHVPERCLVAAGFNDKTLPLNLALPLNCQRWGSD